MNAHVSTRACLLAALLMGTAIAVSAEVDAASPWFRPGGQRPIAPGGVGRDRDRGRDRESEDRRRLYREDRFIRHLYQGFLNRPPSRDEMRFWSERLGKDASPAELVEDFMASDEYFVRQTYIGLLGREPDASGMKGYLQALQGGDTRADVVEAFLSSGEFRQRLR